MPTLPYASTVVTWDDVLPTAPPHADGPQIAVLASLNFPDMDEPVAELIRRFTCTALQELHDQGARIVPFDTSVAPRPAPTEVISCDGVLVLGGGDADPTLYGVEGPVRNLYGVDRCSDDHAIATLRAVLREQVPLLCISRGAQMLNLAQGGTLVPDLDDWHLHRGGPGESLFLDEHVSVSAGSRLHTILGSTELVVRSGHHQAVDAVGEDLVATAWGDDGVIEGIEHTRTWAVGVQWHPEDDHGAPDARHALFGGLVAEAAQRRAARRR